MSATLTMASGKARGSTHCKCKVRGENRRQGASNGGNGFFLRFFIRFFYFFCRLLWLCFHLFSCLIFFPPVFVSCFFFSSKRAIITTICTFLRFFPLALRCPVCSICAFYLCCCALLTLKLIHPPPNTPSL